MDANGMELHVAFVDIQQISAWVANMLTGLLRADSASQPIPEDSHEPQDATSRIGNDVSS